MKKINFFLLILLLPFLVNAQGLKFEEGTFTEVLAKAKKEKKMVFMDVYTTWCGPCKMMAAQLFPAKEAGEVYNSNFINYKVDAEKGEGVTIAEKYKVEGYPTNLFLDAEGNVVFRVMGAGDLKWFIENAHNAIAESKDLMSLEQYAIAFDKGNNKKDFLEKYIAKSNRIGVIADEPLNAYVKKYIKRKISDKQLVFLLDNNQTTDNLAFELLKNNQSRVDALKKEDAPDYFNNIKKLWFNGTVKKFATTKDEAGFNIALDKFMKDAVDMVFQTKWFYKDQFYKYLGDEDKIKTNKVAKANEITTIPLSYIKSQDEKLYKEVKEQVVEQLKQRGLQEPELSQQADKYISSQNMNKAFSLDMVNDLNELAWSVYENKDKSLMPQAVQWASKAIELSKGSSPDLESAILDTYARLLYENGDKEKAILNQGKAIELLKNSNNENKEDGVAEMEEALGKMKSGTL